MRSPFDASGFWRASLRTADGWRVVREPRGPYADASLIEWGSITKGVVGTTAVLTLDVEQPVVHYLPDVPDPDMTVADLVQHTSGLPRLPATMRDRVFGDPYHEAVGVPLDLALVVSAGHRGQYVYSNLGYAVLGAVLDRVHGDWFAAAREHVLEPAGVRSATLAPPSTERAVPKLFGRPVRPWDLGNSSFAAAGGMWSTFEDLCRYADWVLESGPDRLRSVSWRREGATTWINGEVRAAGASIVNVRGITAVVHALAKAPHAADGIATALIQQELAA